MDDDGKVISEDEIQISLAHANGDSLNEGRMRRQSVHMDAIKSLLKSKIQANSSFANTMYDTISDYMVSDIGKKKFAKLALDLAIGEEMKSLTIEGEKGIDELEWETFTLDENSLMEVILQLIYKEYK